MPIEHVVVLALENRSFDHMLGYLQHPNAEFDGLLNKSCQNPGWEGEPAVATSPNAKFVLPLDPDHSHDSVMEQLALDSQGKPQNTGFVTAYERKGRGLATPQFGGLLAPIVRWNELRKNKKDEIVKNRGPLIMLSQSPEHVPVLSTLALEFATCTRWFCSVPGETWPNRNFMHAATSDGETNIESRFYKDKTIFELLEKNQATWNIFYDDTPQVWAYKELWEHKSRRANWFHISHFAEHVAAGTLPQYTFIEPNHRPPFHLVDDPPTVDRGDTSNNQHPGNNKVKNANYDNFDTTEPVDFVRGESLIANVYETLRANPDVFAKTLLVITYDEHGGTFDHVPPPTDAVPPGDKQGSLTKVWKWLFHRKANHFDFKMLGPRVPTVLISPLIEKGKVTSTIFDHSSIPATVRHLFAPSQKPLTQRDAHANTFDSVCELDTPRTDLPDLSKYVIPRSTSGDEIDLSINELGDGTHMPEYYQDLVDLSDNVRKQLERQNIAQVNVGRNAPKRLRAHRTTTAFRAAAHNARGVDDT